jgi:hypothetical protein
MSSRARRKNHRIPCRRKGRVLGDTAAMLKHASDPVTDRTVANRSQESADPGEHDVSLIEARTNACQWADRALELNQAGELDRAHIAEAHAEIWLTRMLEIEARLGGSPPGEVRRKLFSPPAQTARAQRGCSKLNYRAGLSEIPAMDQTTVANSVMLRAWKRPSS